MNFTQAIASVFRNYVGFSGRAPRSEYWYWFLFIMIVSVVTGLIDRAVLSNIVWSPLSTIFALATFLPGLAVAIRRLHDVDRTGWWLLIGLTVVGIILLFYWACVKGTTGPNRFGADPLGGA